MNYLTGTEEIDRDLRNHVKTLPEAIRELLASDEVDVLVNSIGRRYELDEETKAALIQEIALVLLVVEPLDDFETIITTRLLIEPDDAEEISAIVYEKIFNRIDGELRRIYAESPAPAETASQPSTQMGYASVVQKQAQTQDTLLESPAEHTLIKQLQQTLKHEKVERPYVGEPAAKASYNSMLDVPNYSALDTKNSQAEEER